MSSGKPAILFIVFNRPELTRSVYEKIKEYNPDKLYIAIDGPRSHVYEDVENVSRVLGIVTENDELKTKKEFLIRDNNLGCGKAVSDAISWFFKHVSNGIILEDDCLPTADFFNFCEQLLPRYENDSRIMQISGNNLYARKNTSFSYSFSRFGFGWGWATWRRAWSNYDFDIISKVDVECKKLIYRSVLEKYYWDRNFNKVLTNKIDTWDYQWLLTKLLNNGLSIIPRENLVENIGIDSNATHMTNKRKLHYSLSTKKFENDLTHPVCFLADDKADDSFILRAILRKILPY